MATPPSLEDLQRQLEELQVAMQREQGRDLAVTARVDSYRVPKIPPFWRDDPETWFLQVEATFRVAGIKTDRSRADYLISAVDSEVAKHIRDIVSLEPPPDEFYKALKDRILATFATSSEARLRQLLKGQALGDRKPSLLLSHMRQLNGGQCNDAVLRSLFLEQLPEAHRSILVAMDESDLQKLAKVADKIVETSGLDTALVPIQNQSCTESSCNAVAKISIESQMSELIKRMSILEKKVDKSLKGDARSRSRSNSRERDSSQSTKDGLCVAHRKYGTNAYSCRKPCTLWKDPVTPEN